MHAAARLWLGKRRLRLLRERLLTEELDASVCADEPEVAEDFLAETLSCGTSTTLLPSP